jgi:hypothetical protein
VAVVDRPFANWVSELSLGENFCGFRLGFCLNNSLREGSEETASII